MVITASLESIPLAKKVLRLASVCPPTPNRYHMPQSCEQHRVFWWTHFSVSLFTLLLHSDYSWVSHYWKGVILYLTIRYLRCCQDGLLSSLFLLDCSPMQFLDFTLESRKWTVNRNNKVPAHSEFSLGPICECVVHWPSTCFILFYPVPIKLYDLL